MGDGLSSYGFASPARYATLYAEARLEGREEGFEAALSGKRVEEKRRKPCPVEEQPVIGQHTAKVIEEPSQEPVRQRELF